MIARECATRHEWILNWDDWCTTARKDTRNHHILQHTSKHHICPNRNHVICKLWINVASTVRSTSHINIYALARTPTPTQRTRDGCILCASGYIIRMRRTIKTGTKTHGWPLGHYIDVQCIANNYWLQKRHAGLSSPPRTQINPSPDPRSAHTAAKQKARKANNPRAAFTHHTHTHTYTHIATELHMWKHTFSRGGERTSERAMDGGWTFEWW